MIISGNVFNLKISISNEMVIDFNVLRSGVKKGIGSNSYGRNIITLEFGSIGKKNAQIFQQLTKPTRFWRQ